MHQSALPVSVSLVRAITALTVTAAAPAVAADGAPRSLASEILPPMIPWKGASERLIVEPNDPWITPAEASGFRTTPRYAEVRPASPRHA